MKNFFYCLLFLLHFYQSRNTSKNNLKVAERILKQLLQKQTQTRQLDTNKTDHEENDIFSSEFTPYVPPPPPVFAIGQNPVQTTYHIIKYPHHRTTPWNLFNYPRVHNPFYGHLWPHHPLHGASYGYLPHGMNPFMYQSMGAHGMNPLAMMNPYFGASHPQNNFYNPMSNIDHQTKATQMQAQMQASTPYDTVHTVQNGFPFLGLNPMMNPNEYKKVDDQNENIENQKEVKDQTDQNLMLNVDESKMKRYDQFITQLHELQQKFGIYPGGIEEMNPEQIQMDENHEDQHIIDLQNSENQTDANEQSKESKVENKDEKTKI